MKTLRLKKIILIAAAMILALSMCACTVDPSDDGSDMKTITVNLNIDYPDSDEGEEITYPEDIEDYEMQVEEGATVMQILEAYASQNNLEVTVDDTSATVYVTAIGGVESGDSTGWIYEVNDESVMEEAAKCIPVDGDKITWEFIEF